MLLKGVIAEEDWKRIQENLSYNYTKDGHYAEMRDMDLLNDRLNLLNMMEPYIGQWFSKEYVQKHVFRMSEDDIEKMQEQIEKESEEGETGELPPGEEPPAEAEPPPEGEQPPQEVPPQEVPPEGEEEEEFQMIT